MRRLVIAALVLVAACSPGTPRLVACLGDSNTAFGWPEADRRRWCELLGEFPEAAGTRIDNLARGGAQLHGPDIGLPYGDVQLDWARAEGRPDVVVLAFGTNDLRYGSSPRAVARRYQALRRRAEAGGAVVYLALTPPVLPPDPDAARIAREVTRLNLLLRETWPSSRLLDFHTGFGPGDFESDGVHLSDAGQRKRAAVARRILAPRS